MFGADSGIGGEVGVRGDMGDGGEEAVDGAG